MENADFYSELKKKIGDSKKRISKDKLAKLKHELCKKYGIKKIPTDIEVLLNLRGHDADESENENSKKNVKSNKSAKAADAAHSANKKLILQLRTKPSRTGSGVAIVAIMTKPMPCPHAKTLGPCAYCPGGVKSFFGDVPQSYTGKEPATMRGMRSNYDPYLQVFNRLEQYVCLGHDFQKIELIVMGGTFPSFPEEYKIEFITYALKAMNDFSDYFFISKSSVNKKDNDPVFDIVKFKKFFELPGDVKSEERIARIHKKILNLKTGKGVIGKKQLVKEQFRNEKSFVKCVGMTIETRPDHALLKHANELLDFGCTRVELGIQSIHDDVLKRIKRGHTVKDSVAAIKILKDLGFKLNFHMMPGLPESDLQRDEEMFLELFKNQDFKPDMLKIYPCMVVQGTELYDDWQKGYFKPLTTEEAALLIAKIKENVPEYCRIMRVQRDIPSTVISAGVDRTNLRQYIDAILKKRDKKCRCIRCREPRLKDTSGKFNIKIKTQIYQASDGVEFFISAEDNKKDILFGFCRMRFPSQKLRKEITLDSAIIRELHVYGQQELITDSKSVSKKSKEKSDENSFQHKGLGKKLLAEAEQIAHKNKKKKIVIISGIGAREYYKKIGYVQEGPYMAKKI
ncbi:MAG: tRNA uridine(34) 5-carboxymethylaminomethyl modification radical SAM/GNAT enzyme Elp3 [Nanoarchaeota archaeon]|nr:tRNA uridine(34) 5-carboxymethylaminomethyl modification radical SAM/GNAT enzyme Elp3 [Nanoarchaeota archaeon]